MNMRFRFAIAIMASVLLHAVVLLWLARQEQARIDDGQGIIRVFLSQGVAGHSARGDAATSARKDGHVAPQKDAGAAKAAGASRASGRLYWRQPPAYSQQEMVNAMQQAQVAQQRQQRTAAVMAGLAELSGQLALLLRGQIVCVQSSDEGIDCTPAPDEELQPLLLRFFSLAAEARQLGLAGNPVRLEAAGRGSASIEFPH